MACMSRPFSVTVLSPRPGCFAVVRQVSEEDDGRRAVRLDVTCVAGEPVEAGVRVELRLGPSDDPRWLVPGVFYGENRVAGCRVRYPRFTVADPDPARLESAQGALPADRCAPPPGVARGRTRGAGPVTQESAPLG